MASHSSAVASDDVYLHVSPGRETDRFYRLAENDPISLLRRATVPKPVSGGAAVAAASVATKKGEAPAPPPPPPMENWWLVRGSQGQTGWVYSGLIAVKQMVLPVGIARRSARGELSISPTPTTTSLPMRMKSTRGSYFSTTASAARKRSFSAGRPTETRSHSGNP